MKRLRRNISMLVALLMVTTLGTACASKKEEPKVQSKTELKVAIMDIGTAMGNPAAKDDKIFNDMQSKIGISIKPIQITWNDWAEKAKLWAASNELPDIFANAVATDNPGLYNTWSSQGVIKALPEDLSKYPNIKKIMELPSVQPLKRNGKFYMIPRLSFSNANMYMGARGIIYRKDLGEKVGFNGQPKNFQEFLTAMKAIVKNNPGITGLSVNSDAFMQSIFLGSYPEVAAFNGKAWVKENGQWIPAFASSKIIEGIKQLRTLYTEEVLDKDFATQKDQDAQNKFYSGKSASLAIGLGINADKAVDVFSKVNPNTKVADAMGIMTMWPAADGKVYGFSTNQYWSETYFNSKMDDKTFAKALELMEYTLSNEWWLSSNIGIEGTDYKVDNGKVVSLLTGEDTIGKKYPVASTLSYLGKWSDELAYNGKLPVNTNVEKAKIVQQNMDFTNKFFKTATPAPLNYEVSMLSTPAKDKVSAINWMNDVYKIILAKDDVEKMWKDVLKSYDAKGLQEAIKEVNEKVK